MHAQYSWASQGIIVLGSQLSGAGPLPRRLLAHEIAHSWWGHAVQPRDPGERFLTESLAEYSAWRYLDWTGATAAPASEASAARRRAFASDAALRNVRFADDAYHALAYERGPLALRHLASRIGDEALDRVLAAYHARFAGAHPDADAFLAVLDEVGNAPPDAFPWMQRPGHHRAALVDASWSVADRLLRATLDVRGSRKEFAIPFRGTIVVKVRTERGAVHVPVVFDGRDAGDASDHAAAQRKLEIPCTLPPRSVALDPDARYLLEVDPASVAIEGAPADAVPPRIAAVEPDVTTPLDPATTELRVRFTEPMAAATGFRTSEIEALAKRGLRYPDFHMRWEEDGEVLVLVFDRLEPATRYGLPFGDRFRDLWDNILVAETIEFRTP